MEEKEQEEQWNYQDMQMPIYPIDSISAICEGRNGLSKRENAAIRLKVPDSGRPWLDEMIRKSRKIELVGMAMQGMLANPEYLEAITKNRCLSNPESKVAEVSLRYAGELLKQELL